MENDNKPKKLNREDIEWLWYFNYYDLPLWGLCKYQSRPCFFCLADIPNKWEYLIHELPEDDYEWEKKRNEVVLKYLGTGHMSYYDSTIQDIVRDQSLWPKYYEMYTDEEELQRHEKYQTRPVVGYVDA